MDLRPLLGVEKIEAAVEHQNGYLHARGEVDRLDIWHRSLRVESGDDEYRRFESRLDSKKHRRHGATPTYTHVGEAIAIDIGARLQIVDRAAHIFGPRDDVFAKAVGLARIVVRHLVSALVRALVDWENDGSPALEHVVEQSRM
jgi:hypothetical protein